MNPPRYPHWLYPLWDAAANVSATFEACHPQSVGAPALRDAIRKLQRAIEQAPSGAEIEQAALAASAGQVAPLSESANCAPPPSCPFCGWPYGIGKPHAPDCQRHQVAERVRRAVPADEAPSPTENLRVTVYDGKYTVIQHRSGQLDILRYGKPWREAVFDNVILALASELERLRGEIRPVQVNGEQT